MPIVEVLVLVLEVLLLGGEVLVPIVEEWGVGIGVPLLGAAVLLLSVEV